MTEQRYEIEPRRHLLRGKRWHFRLRAANGRIVASGQASGYANKTDCLAAVKLVQTSAGAPIVYLTGT